MRFTVLLLAGGVAGAPMTAPGADLSGVPPGNAERGKKIYMEQFCYTCHGTVGQGGERGAGPRIAPDPWPYAAFARQTRKPRAVMIPYSEKTLPEQDLIDIYHYILTIRAPPAKDIPLLREF